MGAYYVTTAIPYVNAEPHLGFALELVQADVFARFHRLRGDDTRFLTGTDENSLTNVLAAERAGVPVRALVDRHAARFQELTSVLGVSNDDFIRTATDPRHVAGARRFWQACATRGDVYRRPYRGAYCVRCERFVAPDELVSGRCPEHETVPEVVEEENYFFRLSRYGDALGRLLDDGTLRVIPETRHREIRAFVARGLEDFSISRTRARARGWGIEVPDDPGQVIYVWFDALTNYVTALGYGAAHEDPLYGRYWRGSPARVHVIGKDILRFHAVYWPAMLLSVGAAVPTTILVHGFLTRDGRKMSKSLGTGVDPVALARAWGVDAVRYWLLRHVPPTGDADFSDDAFSRVYIAELADDLGNLVSRVVGMLHRYRAGVIPRPAGSVDAELPATAVRLRDDLARALGEAYDPRAALDAVFALVTRSNRHVEAARPWALAREERAGSDSAARRLDAVLYELTETGRLVAEGLRPLLPDTAGRIAAALGLPLAVSWARGLEWGGARPGQPVGRPTVLFPRPDIVTGGPGRASEPAPAGPVSGPQGNAGTGARPPGA
jgi:methionyl-tRNA synthetase